MNKNLETTFTIITEHLVAGKSPLVKLFQPGLDTNEVDSKVKGLNIILPKEVYTLYKWHNGIEESELYTYAQSWLFPLGLFSSIERSIGGYNYYAGKDGYWKESMFMLFETGAGDMYLIDCDSSSKTYKQIFKHDYSTANFDVIITMFDSLETMFLCIAECYQKKIYYFDDEGNLESDDDKESQIMKRNNPNSRFWDIYDWTE
jgi:cell wall assembly regulator SMI1